MRVEWNVVAQIDLTEQLDNVIGLVYSLTEGGSGAVDVLCEQYFHVVSLVVVM